MSKRKRKENPDLKATCLEEIEVLSKEINCLENDLEIKERRSAELFSNGSLAGIIDHLRVRHPSTRNSRKKSNEEQEINSLLCRLAKLESLTGIIFDKNKAELITSTDDNNNNNGRTAKKWRRILSGKCFSLSFVIELETEEMPEEEESANVQKGIVILNMRYVHCRDCTSIMCVLGPKCLGRFSLDPLQFFWGF